MGLWLAATIEPDRPAQRGFLMVRTTVTRLALAAALLISFPVATAAQVDEPSPEGVEWHLAGYAVDGEVGIVPWHVDPTLVLEDGSASGSGGCNRFTGTYALDGDALTFDAAFTMTSMACTSEAGEVEDAYMAALPRAAGWSVEDDVLSLFDEAGERLLDFERAVVSLTASDVAALAVIFADQRAQLDRLDERVDDIRVGTLRDRIKELESQVKALRAANASSSSGSTFDSAEKQLLRGIPSRIRGTCKPLRSNLPAGTLAAVRCDPGAARVKEMAYYLMPYKAAERTFSSIMDSHGVPERYRCHDGRPSQTLQSPYHATGCFVDDTRANIRLVTWAAGCLQMDVKGKRVKEPVTYIAIEGTDGRIKPLFEWSNTSDFELTAVWTGIPMRGNPPSPVSEGLAF